MIALQPVILFGLLLIPFSRGEDIWMLDVKQSPRSPEKQIPGKLLWTLSTPTGLSCAALCLQKTECLFYGYQNHVCHGYLDSRARSSTVEMSTMLQGHFRRYLKRKRRYFKKKGMKEQVTKDKKSKGVNERAITDHKSKAVDDGYKHLTSRRTHLYVKKHMNGTRREEAVEVCQAEGATLVKLDTRKKVQLFMKTFRDRHVDEQSFLIGLNDRYDNDTWYWADGTRLRGYLNWDIGEPDDGYEGKKENCACIILRRYFSGKWFDYPCQYKRPFVCERF